MGRKKRSYGINPKLKVIFAPILLLIFIFKLIGDVLIELGKIHLTIWMAIFKLTSPFLLFIQFLSKPVFIQSSKTIRKSKVIYRRFKIPSPRLYMPKFIKKALKNWKQKFAVITTIRWRINYWTIQMAIIKLKYFILGAVIVALFALYYQINLLVISLPTPDFLTKRDISATTKIYDRFGKFLYEIYSDENRTPLKLTQIPQIVKTATIAIEDKDFYLHKGYSPQAIIRALLNNMNSKSIQGGSTITQQLVRSALLTPEKTVTRKIKELILSIRTEQLYTKDQILEMYLNQVPYGGTAWGIEAAAQTYFGKSVKDVNLAETALLVGLPASPTTYSPFGENPDLATARQKEVLNKMLADGFITNGDYDKAMNTPLVFKKPYIPIEAPHFVMYVKNLLEQEYGPRLVSQGGLRVTTTLDLALNEEVQKIVTNQIDSLIPLHVTNGAALVTNPKTGEILAMVGSRDYFDKTIGGTVNLTTSLRQPGSSIKVVNYAKALENGYTAGSYISDTPVTFSSSGSYPYSPINYDGKYHGWVTLRTALGSSYNIPAVKVLNSIGVDNMVSAGKKMGITSWDDSAGFGLSLTLGGGAVTMTDMATVYGTLANYGVRTSLTPFIRITDWTGKEITLPNRNTNTQAVPPGIAYIINDILADNSARTPAFGPASALVIPDKTVSVKTGTSDNKRDNWTIGYTPQFVTSVWVGNNDNSPMDPKLTSGVSGAAPIWHDIMSHLISSKDDLPFVPPHNVVAILCRGRKEYFLKGTEPKYGCTGPPTVPVSPSSPTPTKKP